MVCKKKVQLMSTKQFSYYFLLFFIIVLVNSCVNDLETIERVTSKSDAPDDVTENLKILHTDSGYSKFELYATIAETYTQPEAITKLKDGLKINFFNDKGEIVSSLSALYGEIDAEKGTFYAKDSVELYNYAQKQRLETEELTWNQKDSSIVTNKPVIVYNKKGIMYGDGLRSKQDFSTYEFISPKGTIDIKNKEDE
jgi:LPS export ABC transporter protein LptC